MVAVYRPFICMFCCLFANDNIALFYGLSFQNVGKSFFVRLCALQFSHVNCASDMLDWSDLFLITTKRLIDPLVFSSNNWLRWWMMLEIISI